MKTKKSEPIQHKIGDIHMVRLPVAGLPCEIECRVFHINNDIAWLAPTHDSDDDELPRIGRHIAYAKILPNGEMKLI